MNKKGDIIWGLVIVAIAALLLSPPTNVIYEELNGAHPYLMSFVKFMILASMGEALALRITGGKWTRTKGLVAKGIIWGFIGMMIVFMFNFYLTAVDGMIEKGYLFNIDGFGHNFLKSFYISAIMNTTFAPAFMAAHRISDTFIDMKVESKKPKLGEAVDTIDWQNFYKFVIAKTIPFFWIPAHTFTFMLPANYRILVAAALSIALGIILAFGKVRVQKQVVASEN